MTAVADAGGTGPFLAVGEALVSFGAPVGVRLEDAPAVSVHVAGAELNFAVGLVRLGVPSTFAGAVGDDVWGRRVRRALAAEGVGVDALASDPGRPTGLLFKEGVAGPDLRVHYRRRDSAGAAYVGGEVLRRVARAARGLHMSGISLVVGSGLRAACLEALAALTPDAFCSFDLNVRRTLAPAAAWRSALAHVGERADLVLATRQELEGVGVDAAGLGQRLGARGAALVLRSDGGETEIHGPEGIERVAPPLPRGPVVDVVGAGDAFAAAVVALRLGGAPWARAVFAGHLAGACAVGRLGDYEGAPYKAELEVLFGGGGLSR